MATGSHKSYLPRVDWRLDISTVLRAFGIGALVLYAAIVAGSLGRAYTTDGGLAGREQELSRLETRLSEEKARTERLHSQIRAFDRDAEVRMSVIRNELGMLRPEEQFVAFK